MRIDEEQRLLAVNELKRRFGNNSYVWLFGSRTDDARRGGDIDLYIEAESAPKVARFMKKIEAGVALERIFGGVKVDLLVRYPTDPENAFHRIAKKRGIQL